LFFSSRRRHTRSKRDWSSDVCSTDLQTISNNIKDQLKKHDEITAIKAVNTPKTAVLAVEIDHLKRFKLADHRKTYKKEIEKAYPNLNVALSTDQKLI